MKLQAIVDDDKTVAKIIGHPNGRLSSFIDWTSAEPTAGFKPWLDSTCPHCENRA
jgi:hypothetical protein